jgi:hypothetical protein
MTAKKKTQPKDPYLLEDLKSFLKEIFEGEHKAIVKGVTDEVTNYLSDYLKPWHETFETIISGQSDLKKGQEELNKLIHNITERLDKIDDKDTGKLVKLESKVEDLDKQIKSRPTIKYIIIWVLIAGLTFLGIGIGIHALFF